MVGEGFVQLADEGAHFGDEFNEALGNEDGAELLAVRGAVGDGLGDLVDDLLERETALGDFLGDERDVRMRLQRALQGDVRGRAAHELDEVPVFAGRNGVALDVSDEVGVNLAGRVEAKARLDVLAAQVAINRLRNADYTKRGVVGLGKLGELRGVGIRVVAADDHQRGEVVGFRRFEGLEKILVRFEFRAARADDVEPAGIAVALEELGVDFDALVREKAVRAIQETDERAFGMDAFDGVEESCDDIVSAGGWATGEDHADADRGGCDWCGAFFKGHGRQVEGVGKEGADFAVAGCRQRSLLRSGCRAERGRELGTVC